MSALCRDFKVSRKTGYKWLKRYRERGVRGLEDVRSGPRPGRSPLRTSAEMAIEIINLRRRHATWGSRKLHAVLKREWPADEVPSRRTVERVLQEAGLVAPRKVRRRKHSGPEAAPVVVVDAPNDLWTVDFKGWWRALNGKKIEPLTVRDQFSRFVLCSEVVKAPSTEDVRAAFEALFIDHGMPRAIQSDNGPPFATTQSAVGLTRLSAWWVSLGIRFVRSRVGCRAIASKRPRP
jgi:putative transposase